MEERIRQLVLLHFEGWLAGGGQAWCEGFVEQRLFEPPVVAGLLYSPPPVFQPNPRHDQAMVHLARTIPHHPIFRFATLFR